MQRVRARANRICIQSQSVQIESLVVYAIEQTEFVQSQSVQIWSLVVYATFDVLNKVTKPHLLLLLEIVATNHPHVYSHIVSFRYHYLLSVYHKCSLMNRQPPTWYQNDHKKAIVKTKCINNIVWTIKYWLYLPRWSSSLMSNYFYQKSQPLRLTLKMLTRYQIVRTS